MSAIIARDSPIAALVRRLSCTLLLLLSAAGTHAHPAVSVVIDGGGNVYYSDLEQVWKVAPDGSKSVVVAGVHTHELSLDAEGNLYGEHLWYEGEATDRWGHYVWRRAPNGRVTRIIGPRPGFLTGYSFVRDAAGNMYWAERGTVTRIRKRASDGAVSTVASANFRNVRWMTSAPEGVLYLIDYHDLIGVSPDGTVRTIARDLAKNPPGGRRGSLTTRLISRVLGDQHFLMGLWTGPRGEIYVARAGAGDVLRVTADGRVRVLAKSEGRWSPTGGAIAPNGDLWILEGGVPKGARLRRIPRALIER